jgi:hypothetical protein
MVGGAAVHKPAGQLPNKLRNYQTDRVDLTHAEPAGCRNMALRHGGNGSRSFFWQAYDSGALAAGLFAVGSSLAIGLAIGSSQVRNTHGLTCASSRISCHHALYHTLRHCLTSFGQARVPSS